MRRFKQGEVWDAIRDGIVRAPAIRAKIGLSESMLSQMCAILVAKGHIARDGATKAVTYRIAGPRPKPQWGRHPNSLDNLEIPHTRPSSVIKRLRNLRNVVGPDGAYHAKPKPKIALEECWGWGLGSPRVAPRLTLVDNGTKPATSGHGR